MAVFIPCSYKSEVIKLVLIASTMPARYSNGNDKQFSVIATLSDSVVTLEAASRCFEFACPVKPLSTYKLSYNSNKETTFCLQFLPMLRETLHRLRAVSVSKIVASDISRLKASSLTLSTQFKHGFNL